MNYIKIFQNAHALSISVGNSYSEDQLMHTYMDNFHQSGKYPAQIASHQAELRREKQCTDQKSFNITSLQTDYLDVDRSSGSGRNSERAHDVQTKCTFCGGTNHYAEKYCKRIRQEKKKVIWLVLRTTYERNGHLEKLLDVDLKITYLNFFQSYQRITINGKSKYT